MLWTSMSQGTRNEAKNSPGRTGKGQEPALTPPKNSVWLEPLTDPGQVLQIESRLVTERPKRRKPLWCVSDEYMSDELKAVVWWANDIWMLHLLYQRQPF